MTIQNVSQILNYFNETPSGRVFHKTPKLIPSLLISNRNLLSSKTGIESLFQEVVNVSFDFHNDEIGAPWLPPYA
jgi:hypothetical protein